MKHIKFSQPHSISLLGAVAAVLASSPIFADTAAANPTATQCADFLGQRPEQKVVTVREILSYDNLGFSLADHATTDQSAVSLATARCNASIGSTVYQAIKGTN